MLDLPICPDYDYLLKEDTTQLSMFKDCFISTATKYDIDCVRYGADLDLYQEDHDSRRFINRLCSERVDKDLQFIEDLKDTNLLCKEKNQSLKYIEYNSTVNFYPEGIEIVKYPQKYKVVPQFNKSELEELGFSLDILEMRNKIDRSRIFIKNQQGDFELNRAITYTEALDKIKDNNNVSRKQTLDNLYSLALSNNWNYFFTLTFDRSKIDSSDKKQVSETYKKFERKLRDLDPSIKSLFIVEYHSDLEHFHLHGFISGNIDEFLKEAFNPKTKEPLYDTMRNRVYNCDLWDYGFSTCVKLQQGYNKLRVCNYISKYINKDFKEIPYGFNVIYHSRGLERRISVNINFTDRELQDFLFSYYYDENAAVHDINLLSDISKSSIYKVKKSGVISIFLTYKTGAEPE